MTVKNEFWVQLTLILLAIGFLSLTIFQYPLVDSDEATYGIITRNMLETGDFWTLQLQSGPWLQKPPLFFWLTALSVKLFGPAEFAYRLPSILMSTLTLWLVYLIVRRLRGSRLAASAAFLMLLTSPQFYAFGREARMDPGLVAMAMLALYLAIRGRDNEKYYLGIFPALAAGILFKNLVVLMALPLIAFFSLIYKNWSWIRSRYFWYGPMPAFLILTPWHIVQSIRYGAQFWHNYVTVSLFGHLTSRVGGSADRLLYPKLLWEYYIPWIYLIILVTVLLIAVKIWKGRAWAIHPVIYSSFLCALLIILAFSFFPSRLSTYILPAFPFLAMFIALASYELYSRISELRPVLITLFLILAGIGGFFSLKTVEILVSPPHYEERDIGKILMARESSNIHTYVFDWPFPETINYYGDTELTFLNLTDRDLRGPLYFVTNPMVRSYFYNREGQFVTGYENLRELYRGQYLVLFYSDRDLTLPQFSHR